MQIASGAKPTVAPAEGRSTASFEAFVRVAEPRLRRALVAAYGFEDGRDATAEAFAYAWENWERLQHVANLAGYLFRVGQSRSRRRRRAPVLFDTSCWAEYSFEPGLPAALAALSQRQRLVVVLVHGYGYTLREVAELTGIGQTTARNHLERGLARLRAILVAWVDARGVVRHLDITFAGSLVIGQLKPQVRAGIAAGRLPVGRDGKIPFGEAFRRSDYNWYHVAEGTRLSASFLDVVISRSSRRRSTRSRSTPRADQEGASLMRKLIVSEFVTLDGVFEDPGGAEGFTRGGWAFRFERGPEGDKFKLDEVMEAGALLLGRVTYEGFAAAWPSATDESGFADKMNSMPKFVVSSTLERGTWANTTVLSGDPVAAVTRLKEQSGGYLLVAGSGQLVRELMRHELIDEYRLMVFPIVLGDGRRLFPDGGEVTELRLAQARAVGAGVMILTYRPAERSAPARSGHGAASSAEQSETAGLPQLIQPGDPFPVELLPDALREPDGTLRRPAVLYFYPKDGTPTCTREAVEFNRQSARFEQAGLELIGVSTDTAESHAAFADDHALSFELVSDADLRLSRAAGVLKDYGEHGVLAGRATFLVDRAGIVRQVWTVDDVAAHPAEVLQAAARLHPDR
jgi:peroxiredoxin/dihydrofolate reductase/DNA-directed RNA polymerase specialized sigma24 family protein